MGSNARKISNARVGRNAVRNAWPSPPMASRKYSRPGSVSFRLSSSRKVETAPHWVGSGLGLGLGLGIRARDAAP